MEDENPYAAPQAELDELDPALKDDPRIRRKDNTLIVPIDAVFPRRCVSCNRPAPHPLKVTIVKPQPEPKRDYRWYAVAAAALAFLFLAGACAGIDLPFELYPISPWIFPFLVGGAGAALLATRWRENITIEFYTCRGHQYVTWYSQVLGWTVGAVGVVFPIYMTVPGADMTWLQGTNILYVYLLIGFVFLSNRISIWCHLNIHGKQLDAHTLEVQGFGKKYLESFPESDDP